MKGSRLLPFWVTFREYFLIFLFTAPYGFATNQLVVPHNLVGGGLTGLCTILYYLSNNTIPIWLSSLLFNLILIAIAMRLIGWRFCLHTLYGSLVLAFWFKIIPIAETPLITDPFMAVILGGIAVGYGLGIIFLNNGSTGGTDIIAMIINKYWHMSLGRILLVCDALIIGSSYFLPNVHSIERVLFGLCYTFMYSTSVDLYMARVRQAVQFFIFSKKYDEIAHAILFEVHRGVTMLHAEGGFSHEEIKVITVLVRKNEADKIFRTVRRIDPHAFVSESVVEGVFGQGFASIAEQTGEREDNEKSRR